MDTLTAILKIDAPLPEEGHGEANDLAASKRPQARSKRMTQYVGEEIIRRGGCNLEMWEMREDSAMETWDEVRKEGKGRWTDWTGGRERMAAPITELLKCLRAILSPRCKMERRHPTFFLHERNAFARVHRHRHCIRVHRAWSSSSGQCFTPLLSSRRSFPWLPYFHAKWIELFRCRGLLLIILPAKYKGFWDSLPFHCFLVKLPFLAIVGLSNWRHKFDWCFLRINIHECLINGLFDN